MIESANIAGRKDPFTTDQFQPAYLRPQVLNSLEDRKVQALKELEDCCACPRLCHVNRLQDKAKVCHTGRHAIVSSVFPHFGEENCLRGCNGSGTIFFGMCNLRCVFCQNWDISQTRNGRECTADQIAEYMLELQERGCHNINFVTPEHVVPQVIEAVSAAVSRGLHLPFVYNTSAYDSIGSLRLMEGLVDIYMPDFKFWTRESARRYAKAKDYPERAREAILEMHRQVGPLVFDLDGLAVRGVLVRHLVMPGMLDEAREIFTWLARQVSRDTYVNIMGQYRPQYQVGKKLKKDDYQDINLTPTHSEIDAAYQAALDAGLWRFDKR